MNVDEDSSRSLGVFAIQRAMPWVESTEWRDVGGEQSRTGEEEGETRNVLHVVVRAKNESKERAIAVPRSTLVVRASNSFAPLSLRRGHYDQQLFVASFLSAVHCDIFTFCLVYNSGLTLHCITIEVYL